MMAGSTTAMEDSTMEAQLGNLLLQLILKIGELVIALGVIGGMFRWLFRDMYDSSIMAAMDRRKEKFRDSVLRVCKPDSDKIDKATIDILTNRDRIEAAHAILLLHGADLRQLDGKIQALPLIQMELKFLNENYKSMDDKLDILLKRA